MKGGLQRIRKKRNESGYSPLSVRFINGAAATAGIIGPLMTMPQLLKIYVDHNASGISVISWFAWMVLDIPFVIYGIVHKDKVIIMTYTAWFFLNLLVAVGALMYG